MQQSSVQQGSSVLHNSCYTVFFLSLSRSSSHFLTFPFSLSFVRGKKEEKKKRREKKEKEKKRKDNNVVITMTVLPTHRPHESFRLYKCFADDDLSHSVLIIAHNVLILCTQINRRTMCVSSSSYSFYNPFSPVNSGSARWNRLFASARPPSHFVQRANKQKEERSSNIVTLTKRYRQK